MAVQQVDGVKLKQAIEQFGSLQHAVEQLQKKKVALEQENEKLKKNNKQLTMTKDKLSHEMDTMNKAIEERQKVFQSLAKQVEEHSRQYELFCGFMAMVAESPSVTDSITSLIETFQKLKESGWHLSKGVADMRSLFVHTVLGDYLKCFRCDACGAKFITNKNPKDKYFGSGYQCPICHNWYAVKEDDSFLKVLVSEKQLGDTQHLEEVLKENEILKPFSAFLNVPCEICHELIEEWDDQNVKLAIEGIGCGHTSCWNSQVGQWRQLGKAIQKVKKDIK